ncbi:MAG: 23S rRNA (adenine(2503)-C(2))-methyltransferase RlmN [Flavobacteriaceae bacterium]|nr:23S rRNA (adenine(2503)-C(2))-methyltransferase RlmN [Flavobacteriaceae bacterium]
MLLEKKKNIRSLSKSDLRLFFEKHDQSSYRADQVYEWLWNKGVNDFDKMTNLSNNLRKLLNDFFVINHVEIDFKQKSIDGTIKNSVRLYDNNVVESVFIPSKDRTTACISSQVGCSLNCKFCATSKLKRIRNLNVDEIFDQVKIIGDQSKIVCNRPLSNIVFMGMGEPLMNYNNVIKAIEIITSKSGLGMSPKRITLSTVGIPKIIKKMADEKVKFKLAISLHSAIQSIRESIMPFSNKFNLIELEESLLYWFNLTKKKITIEYIVWNGINDKESDILALIEFCNKIPSKVNLIEYNPIGDSSFKKANRKVIDEYQLKLRNANIVSTIRRSRGIDIDAACGQLANKS